MSLLRGHITAFLLALLLFCAGQHSSAAHIPDGWDRALDQYEAICIKCLDLRERMLQGEALPADSVKDLLSELAHLREILQDGSGAMSEEQHARFERIRKTYMHITPDNRTADLILPGSETVLPSLISSIPESGLCPPAGAVSAAHRGYWGLAPVVSCPVRKVFSARDLSAGMMLFAHDGRTRLGAYLKGLTTFRYPSVAGNCFRDGTLPGGGYFYASGNTAYSAYAVTGGMLYRFHPVVGVWAGVGYSSETVYWQGADGAWYRVEDASGRGVCPEAGLMLTFGNFSCGRLSILAGGHFPLAKKISIDIGLGWMF